MVGLVGVHRRCQSHHVHRLLFSFVSLFSLSSDARTVNLRTESSNSDSTTYDKNAVLPLASFIIPLCVDRASYVVTIFFSTTKYRITVGFLLLILVDSSPIVLSYFYFKKSLVICFAIQI
jgi:hypothetical protein